MTIQYSQNLEGVTFAIAPLERESFPLSRQRVFVGDVGGFSAMTETDRRAVTKILTGIFEREPLAIFVEV